MERLFVKEVHVFAHLAPLRLVACCWRIGFPSGLNPANLRFQISNLKSVLLFLCFLLCASHSSHAQALTNCTADALSAALSTNGAVVTITNTCSIKLSSPISITGSATLIGPGTNAIISGNAASRIFEIQTGGSLHVFGVTLTGGSHQQGAAVYVHTNAQALFSNCLFSVNWAVGKSGSDGADGADHWNAGENGQPGGDGTSGLGGAIYNLGEVSVLCCRFLNNTATGGSGGTGGDGGKGDWNGGNGGRGGNGATGRGGAIYNLGSLLVRDTTLQGNTATGGAGSLGGSGGDGASAGVAGSGGSGARAVGAAIYNKGFAEVFNSSFVTNTATGGASAADGTLNGGLKGGDGYNGAGGLGGAIANMDSLATTNCTFYGNKAVGGDGGNGGNGSAEAGDGGDGGEAYGGAIYNAGVQWLVNCTVAQNSVTGGTNGIAGSGPSSGSNGARGPTLGGGVFIASSAAVNIKNSIISSSKGAGNGSGAFTDLGNNISSDASIAFGSASFKNRNPLLGSLADNGGPTQTMAPQSGSPAISAGNIYGAPAFDQRGFPRPGSGKSKPDIGAVETQLPVLTCQLVSSTTLALVFPTQAGLSYVTESKNALTNVSWTPLQTNTGTGASITNTYTITNKPGQFYRLIQK